MTIEVKNSVKPVDYLESIEILEKRVDDVLAGKKNELMWILEHNTVYTGGTSSNNKDLIDKNLNIIKTKRGGKYTVHSPGQKIVYFVLNLNKRKKDIRKLINQIEIIIINILKNYKVTSNADKKNIKGNNLMRLLVGQYILERELLGLSGKEKKLSTVINQLENFS